MHILVVPDSFKGSLSAVRFCEIAEDVFSQRIPGAKVTALPIADGGEGTMDTLVAGTGGEIITKEVTGPLGDNVVARYGLLENGVTAIVEMAECSGLPLVPEDRRNPELTTTYGTGELIVDALERGAQKLILGLGGSATNDGGAGALVALGARFLDEDGKDIDHGGGGLSNLHRVDLSDWDQRINNVTVKIASDVTNPLLGDNGATQVYGPQKGATVEGLRLLESGLKKFAEITEQTIRRNCQNIPGAGAAGGMGFGFLSYCDAEIESGFELVARMYGLETLMEEEAVSLIITGEGEINSQSIQGKPVGKLAELGRRYNVPVVAFCGSLSGDVAHLYKSGLVSMSSIVPGPVPLEKAMVETESYLRDTLINFCEFYKGINN